MFRSIAVTVLALLITVSTVAAAPPAGPVVVKASPAPEWDARFNPKEGWIGGDAVYSVALDSGRILWLFGDTLVGKVKDGKRTGIMVNNTIGIQATDKDAIHFVTERGKKPASFFPPQGAGWMWPQAGIYVKSRLFVFLPQVEKTKEPGAFGFQQTSQWLALVENPADEPESWRVKYRQLPMAQFSEKRQRSWGSALLTDGDEVYIYGFSERRERGSIERHLIVARAPASKLDDFPSWRYWGTAGWSEKAADSAPLADGLASEFSVTRAPGKGYIAVYTESGLSDRIVGRCAERPEGPWSEPKLLYQCPEMGKDKGVFCYSAKAQSWATKDNTLLISYCVNSWKFADLFADDRIYRPRFIRVELERR